MSFTNPSTSFVQQYGQTVQMMAQQMQSVMADKVNKEMVVGKRHYFDLYDTNDAMSVVTTRFGSIQPTDTKFERRAVDLVDYDDTKLIDKFDKLKMLIDPAGPVTMAQSAQMGRQIDDIVFNAAFGTMLGGETGSTPISFPASQQVAVNSWKFGVGSGNAGLTISKILEAKEILDKADVPAGDRHLIIDPTDEARLLSTVEATSGDYMVARNLVTGKVEGLAGFKIYTSTRLLLNGSSHRRCLAYHKSGLALAVGQEPQADISQNKNIRGLPWQAYISLSMGATRLENKKVVEIITTTT